MLSVWLWCTGSRSNLSSISTQLEDYRVVTHLSERDISLRHGQFNRDLREWYENSHSEDPPFLCLWIKGMTVENESFNEPQAYGFIEKLNSKCVTVIVTDQSEIDDSWHYLFQRCYVVPSQEFVLNDWLDSYWTGCIIAAPPLDSKAVTDSCLCRQDSVSFNNYVHWFYNDEYSNSNSTGFASKVNEFLSLASVVQCLDAIDRAAIPASLPSTMIMKMKWSPSLIASYSVLAIELLPNIPRERQAWLWMIASKEDRRYFMIYEEKEEWFVHVLYSDMDIAVATVPEMLPMLCPEKQSHSAWQYFRTRDQCQKTLARSVSLSNAAAKVNKLKRTITSATPSGASVSLSIAERNKQLIQTCVQRALKNCPSTEYQSAYKRLLSGTRFALRREIEREQELDTKGVQETVQQHAALLRL